MENLQNTDNHYWLEKAKEVAKQSGCFRENTRWGAVAVRDGKMIASGFNGAPNRIRSCFDRGTCIRQTLKIPHGANREIAHCLCAEQRLICNAAKNGIDLDGADIYVTGISCTICVRLMIECGIRRVYQIFAGEYENELSKEIAKEAGMDIIYLE